MRLKLTNDAFFALYCGEEPIDEVNLEEAKNIAAQFPHGFTIGEDWVELGDTGLIEAVFTAEQMRPPKYTHSLEIFGEWELLIAVNSNEAEYMFWHPTKESFSQGTSLIELINGKQWVKTVKNGQYPIFKAKRI